MRRSEDGGLDKLLESPTNDLGMAVTKLCSS